MIDDVYTDTPRESRAGRCPECGRIIRTVAGQPLECYACEWQEGREQE